MRPRLSFLHHDSLNSLIAHPHCQEAQGYAAYGVERETNEVISLKQAKTLLGEGGEGGKTATEPCHEEGGKRGAQKLMSDGKSPEDAYEQASEGVDYICAQRKGSAADIECGREEIAADAANAAASPDK